MKCSIKIIIFLQTVAAANTSKLDFAGGLNRFKVNDRLDLFQNQLQEVGFICLTTMLKRIT